ncbi:hypothetical protein HanXRQr2_Chr04g0149231 [Helianthus annuus]|uniref:Uncharacterized protein n=1 Tax=Helianthus annuus TaxID=4232 RepID=A0A9K3NQC4_HELAN|nr:hypothetical protein HanXRQr2_Chr04g0149231 [Helianthus annuus]KAJ0929944.1 hypothetical protein HanPSC8_Chr04g0143651 [Helianthus annuus]
MGNEASLEFLEPYSRNHSSTQAIQQSNCYHEHVHETTCELFGISIRLVRSDKKRRKLAIVICHWIKVEEPVDHLFVSCHFHSKCLGSGCKLVPFNWGVYV